MLPQYKNLLTFLSMVFLCAVITKTTSAQNTPQLSETAPTGTSNVIVPPPAITMPGGGYLNYQRDYVPLFPTTNPVDIQPASPNVIKTVTYKDGFNRPMQVVTKDVAPGKHLIQPIDTRFQRDNYSFLPYASTNPFLSFAPNTFTDQRNYYNSQYSGEGGASYSVSKNISDANQRATKSFAAGKSQVGQNRGMITKAITNDASTIRVWTINGSGLPVSTSYYEANELVGSETTDNEGGKATVYNDKDGTMICKISYLNDNGSPVYGTTYYVYDELGHLRYALPPKAVDLAPSGTITQTVLDNLCFQYTYDAKGQKITQKVPGKSIEEYVYDKRGRLVMYRDGILKAQNRWLITFYDALDRVTVTSTIQTGATWTTMQGYVDDANTYPNTSFLYYIKNYNLMHVYPASYSGGEMLSYTYYDDYDIADPGGTLWNTYSSTLQFTELSSVTGAETPSKTLNTHGLVTGHKVRLTPAFNADPTKVGDWRQDVIYYDKKARPIYTVSKDFYQGNAIHESYSGTQYDFSGKVLVSKHKIKIVYGPTANQFQTELLSNGYDPSTGKLIGVQHKVNSGAWKNLVSYEYDDLGRIKREVLGNSGEVRDYTYNIRGQLTGINGEYAETGDKGGYNRSFGQSLKYDYGFTQPKYDGNVAGMVWRGSNTSTPYAYGYSYDRSGRLTTADFRKGTAINGVYGWSNQSMDYTVSNLTYDKGGNLLSMNQRGMQPGVGPVNMDVLTYNYENSGQSNRLQYVNDGGVAPYGAGDFNNGNTGTNDYTYDVNGNITSDLNKGISTVNYTIWNKPNTVLYLNGANFQYSYDGLGRKLQERYFTSTGIITVTDYVDNFVYKNDTLQYILTPVGRTMPDGKEEFFVKDHLGNIRSTIDVTTYIMQQYLASFEVASANLEGMFFDYIDEVRDQNPSSTDPNNQSSARLNGGDPGHEIGASLLMKVMTGDHININVNNFYEDYSDHEDVPVTVENMLNIIVTTLKAGSGGWVGSESHNTNLVDRLFTPANYTALQQIIDNTANDPTKPKAYLNYILFDENMNIVPEGSGAYQANGSGTWQAIGSGTAKTIPTNGYFAVFLTNKSKITGCLSCGDVFFDQLVVQVNKSNLLEENAYYPFGLPINGLSSTAFGFKDNKYKYQGNKYTKDGLNWMDFHNRQYDPQIGKFSRIDPLAAGTDMFSPYAGMNNNPVSIIDPLGLQGYENLTALQRPQVSPFLGYLGISAKEASIGIKQPNSPYAPGGTHGWATMLSMSLGNRTTTGNAQGNHSKEYVWQDNAYMAGSASSGYELNITATRTEIDVWQPSFNGGFGNFENAWMAPAGQVNSGVGTAGSILEGAGAGYRLGQNLTMYGPRSYAPFQMGTRQFLSKTVSIAKVGKGIGQISTGVGLAMDLYGVQEYYKNPNSPNAVHPGKAALNTGMAAYGIWINPVAGVLYSTVDAFYPGGWAGWMNDQATQQTQIDGIMNTENKATHFYVLPWGAQKL